MTRKVEFDKRLSDEDRAYLHARGEHARVADLDARFPAPAESEEESTPVRVVTQEEPTEPFRQPVTNRSQAVPQAETSSLAGVASDDSGDDYDDESAWTYRDLQAEAGERGLPKSGSREELVARLRKYDMDNSSEESSPEE